MRLLDALPDDPRAPAVLGKYDRFIANQTKPDRRECPNCGHMQDANPGPRGEVTCAVCGKEYCFYHSGAHAGRTCAEYNREQRTSDAAASRNSKKCPGCQRPTVKSSGCNHMTCPGCQMHWCWLCGEGPIEKSEMGGHFAPGAGPCGGRQFEGIDPAVEFARLLAEAGGDIQNMEADERAMLMDHARRQVKQWRNAMVMCLLISIMYWWLMAMYIIKKDQYEKGGEWEDCDIASTIGPWILVTLIADIPFLLKDGVAWMFLKTKRPDAETFMAEVVAGQQGHNHECWRKFEERNQTLEGLHKCLELGWMIYGCTLVFGRDTELCGSLTDNAQTFLIVKLCLWGGMFCLICLAICLLFLVQGNAEAEAAADGANYEPGNEPIAAGDGGEGNGGGDSSNREPYRTVTATELTNPYGFHTNAAHRADEHVPTPGI